MVLLTVNGISYGEKGIFSINNVSFTQDALQNIGIAGETGSGKTTLLKLIGGLLQPASGEMYFEGKKIIGPDNKLIPGNKGIAYLSQHFELLNNYWVYEVLDIENKLDQEQANSIYEVCRVTHLLRRRTNQLSGGERQRVSLAKALIRSPGLLLLDEPFSNLDALHRTIIKAVINDVKEQLGITCILVSHDAADILSWADTVFVLKEGEIIQQGTPVQVYTQPVNEYCAGLFGDYCLVTDRVFHLLTGRQGNPSDEKQWLLRPEHVCLTAEGKNAVKGTIQRSSFWGSYSLLDVLVGEQVIKVRTNKKHLSAGEPVYVTISAEYLFR